MDNTINNVYIKVPENSLSMSAIMSALATKINCVPDDLVILDVKFLQVTDDKGEIYSHYKCVFIDSGLYTYIDIEYWKTPSRKLYVTRKVEYGDILKVKERKKLSLNRKKRPTVIYSEGNLSDEEDTGGIVRLESKLAKVCVKQNYTNVLVFCGIK